MPGRYKYTYGQAKAKARRRNMRKMRKYGRKGKAKIYTFIRRAYIDGPISTGTAQGGSFSFDLAGVPNHSEFTNLYDQYKIKKIVVKMIPRASQTITESPQGGSMSYVANSRGNLFTCLDYDDIAPPTTIAEVLQYQNSKRSSTDRTHTRVLYPAVRSVLYATAGATAGTFNPGYAPKRCWIDCTNDDVIHRGLKWWITDTPGIEIKYDIELTFHLMFKNVR